MGKKSHLGCAVLMYSGAVIPLLKGSVPGFWKEQSSGTSQAALLLLNFSDQVLDRSVIYKFWLNSCQCLLLPTAVSGACADLVSCCSSACRAVSSEV